MTARVRVVYGEDARLHLWVPLEMHERYELAVPVAVPQPQPVAPTDVAVDPLRGLIECSATYSNYRRFDVGVSIR